MREALNDDGPTSPIYVDYLARALAAHLLRKHSASSDAWVAAPAGALTRAQVERVVDYMETNLADPISLTELAAANASGLSASHFARRFKSATTYAAASQYLMSLHKDRAGQAAAPPERADHRRGAGLRLHPPGAPDADLPARHRPDARRLPQDRPDLSRRRVPGRGFRVHKLVRGSCRTMPHPPAHVFRRPATAPLEAMDSYQTKFGALDDYEKGGVEIIDDNPKNYVFSNIFEVCAGSEPYERVAVGKNFEYVIEAVRAEGESGWYAADHDEFVLCMDGEVEVHLVKAGRQALSPAEGGKGEPPRSPRRRPEGRKMGRLILRPRASGTAAQGLCLPLPAPRLQPPRP